jgi:PAS domain S-box-containing protein
MADPLRVLYVDDEPILLKTGKFYLERKGEFAVDTLISAKEAFIRMETEHYDAIISDYQMPGMDGIEFLKKIRASGNTIPFILFTGKGREEVVITALNEGADFYIQKGGEPEPLFAELAHKIRSAAKQHTNDKALQKSEEKYRRIVETSHEGIWAMDGQFVTTYVNERMAEMLGYTVNEILGKTIQSFMSGEDLADQQQKIEERMRGQPGSYERRFRAKDGTILTFAVSATPVMGNDGLFQGSFAMVTDITARKRAEEELVKNAEELHASYEEITATEEELRANLDQLTRQELELRESKRELSDIIEFLPDATFVLDRQGKVIAWNHAIEKMTGISKEEMIGKGDHAYTIPFYGDRRKHLLDLIDLENKELQAKYRHVTRKGNTLYAEVFAPALFGGKGAYVWVTGSPLFDLQKNRIGAIESIREITERKQVEAALRESKRQLDAMATNIPGVVFRYYVNPDGTTGFDYISGRSREILGLENDKATFDNRFTEGIVPENRERFLSSIQHAVTTKTLWEFDSPYVKPSGEKIWVSAVSSPVMENDRLIFDGAFFDITHRKKAEEEIVKKNEELHASNEQLAAAEEELKGQFDALTESERLIRESEERVRNKLESLLSPEGDIGNLDLADIIDVEEIQSMMDDFHALTHIGIAILDINGKILVATGWQDICTKFHRVNPETCANCVQSDTLLASGAEPGTVKRYRCKNNMWDLVTPIVIGGSHVGNLFLGQFLFEDESVNDELFRSQAVRYGFDESSYLAALDRVPRWNRETVDTVMAFYAKFARMVSTLSHSNITLARTVTERDTTLNSLLKVNQKLNVLSQLTRQDLTTQIFIVNSFLEMAKKQAKGQDGIIKNIESGERAVRSIKEITEFTKDYQNMGEKPPKWQNVKLSFLFGLSHISIGEIRHSLETENLEIFADPLLEKAFQGLLENSVKHGGHVSEIRVSHTVTPDWVTVVFEDNGIGISAEKKERIFLRGEGARASVRGLFFVQEILSITGIIIRENGEPGKGARFEMTVPKGAWK